MPDPRTVTVICTTPWGERHEFKAETMAKSPLTVMFPNGQWVVLPIPPSRVFLDCFRYELAPNWRQEIGDE